MSLTTFQKTCFTAWPIIPKHYINCGIQARWSRVCMVIFHGCDRDNVFKFWYMEYFQIKISKFHVFFFQMTTNLAKGCTLTCQMMFSRNALPICFDIFKIKIMQKLKFRVPFMKHRPISLLASRKVHMIVWCHIVTTKHHCTNIN